MTDRRAAPAEPPVGLCLRCVHHRTVGNRRGSRFHLCARSKDDERYPRYPPLPVLRCEGFDAEPAGPRPASRH